MSRNEPEQVKPQTPNPKKQTKMYWKLVIES
jgi:hypothetical protein